MKRTIEDLYQEAIGKSRDCDLMAAMCGGMDDDENARWFRDAGGVWSARAIAWASIGEG
jgi:hypothetical protein